jgi:hypothetical protein
MRGAATPALPVGLARRHKMGFFPGSTLGNLVPVEASRLLRVSRAALSGGSLIVGIDHRKDTAMLVRAYDDAVDATATFNLNLLVRINRELGGNFDLRASSTGPSTMREGRIEMHLVSLQDQSVRIRGWRIHFRAGESIHTENSYKYSISQFRHLGCRVACGLIRAGSFSVHELTSARALGRHSMRDVGRAKEGSRPASARPLSFDRSRKRRLPRRVARLRYRPNQGSVDCERWPSSCSHNPWDRSWRHGPPVLFGGTRSWR